MNTTDGTTDQEARDTIRQMLSDWNAMTDAQRDAAQMVALSQRNLRTSLMGPNDRRSEERRLAHWTAILLITASES